MIILHQMFRCWLPQSYIGTSLAVLRWWAGDELSGKIQLEIYNLKGQKCLVSIWEKFIPEKEISSSLLIRILELYLLGFIF